MTDVLKELANVLEQRKSADAESSYVSSLHKKGLNKILEKVGEGGMATVYRGKHLNLDREVAVKVLHPHLSNAIKNRKRFSREAHTIEQLKHPNIVQIHDYSGQESETCYIITEFIEGWTLQDLLEKHGPLPAESCCHLRLWFPRSLF